jgi:hypothetical protein
MSVYKNKKAYIVATAFGLSLVVIIPTVSFAQSVGNRQIGLLKSGVQVALFKPHLAQNQTHFGLVAGVSGSVFVLNNTIGATTALTVSTNPNTVFKRDGVADSVTGLTVGQHVVVMGVTDALNNTISAKSVNIITHEPTKNSLKHVFKKQK